MVNFDSLKSYIDESILVHYDNYFKLRMSPEIKEKYLSGSYNTYLAIVNNCFKTIKDLHIKYDREFDEVLYIYMVPDENCLDMLNVPNAFRGKNSCFKPVPCFDDNSFQSALGMSQNIAEGKDITKIGIPTLQGITHEIAHLIGNEFFPKYSLFGEGFAETVSLYILGYEDFYDEHKNILMNLSEEDILTPKEIINSINDGSFGKETLTENTNCSFRKSYMSSYLFVRGCIEQIENTFNLSKRDALQKFLDTLKHSCDNNYHVEDVIKGFAKDIGLDPETILDSKEMQLNIVKSYNTKRLR